MRRSRGMLEAIAHASKPSTVYSDAIVLSYDSQKGQAVAKVLGRQFFCLMRAKTNKKLSL
jgi:hypothetical protein